MSESFTNFDQAAEALAAAVQDSQGGNSDYREPATPEYTPTESQPNTPNTQDDQGTPSEETSFLDSKSIDLNSLDQTSRDFLQAREREMQAAFTRKTQELAAARAEAEQATQFLSELNSNPEFAYEVQNRLASELERLGYSPQEAANEAQNQLQNQSFEEDDPYLAKINELEAWKNQQEQRIREAEVASKIDRETAVIQSQNPNFTDDDFATIYGLALSLNGSLQQATEAYKSVTQRAVERYISQKESVPATFKNQPTATNYSEEAPASPMDLGDPRLRQAALARLRAEGYE